MFHRKRTTQRTDESPHTVPQLHRIINTHRSTAALENLEELELKTALSQGADPYETNDMGDTALHAAIKKGDVLAAEILLQHCQEQKFRQNQSFRLFSGKNILDIKNNDSLTPWQLANALNFLALTEIIDRYQPSLAENKKIEFKQPFRYKVQYV